MNIQNKKALFDYTLLDRIEAGVQLTGAEVKSIKGGHAQLEGSFVRVIDKWCYGYHHFISRQWNFFDPAAFELKNNLF